MNLCFVTVSLLHKNKGFNQIIPLRQRIIVDVPKNPNHMAMKVISILCALLTVSQCSNILFVTIFPNPSRQALFQPIWKELSLRGHNVVVITPNPLRDEKLTNLTEIDISKIYNLLWKYDDEDVEELRYHLTLPIGLSTLVTRNAKMTKLFNNIHKMVFDLPNVQDFLRKSMDFDVVITESLYPTLTAFGPKYNAPLIGLTSSGAPIPGLDTVGNPTHPINSPYHNFPVGRDMSIKEIILFTIWAVYLKINYYFIVLPREDALARKHLGNHLPYLGNVEFNLIIRNKNPIFPKSMPILEPVVVELGYMQKNVSELDDKMKEFLDQSKNGVVYFSLGSNIKPSVLPPKYIKEIVGAFRKLSYDVIFKWDQDILEDMPKNVLISKWVPQEAVLRHNKTVVFVTQGGVQSCEEAIINEVPIIGIPFFPDQISIVDTMVEYGVGKRMNYAELTAYQLSVLIEVVIENPIYKENIINLKKLYTDQQTDGLDERIWWIEYVIRHKGASHLKNSGKDVYWYQKLLSDMFSFGSFLFVGVCMVSAYYLLYVMAKHNLLLIFYLLRKFREGVRYARTLP